ncbi:MAG: hypothetical protein ACI83Y_001193 [Candidatus Azotimanducaceae bacterium]
MASSPQSYQKRQRELRKKEKKAEKQAVRHGKSAAKDENDDDDVPDEDALLEEFRVLNESFAAGDVTQDDFDYRKADLFHKMGLGEAPEPREEDAKKEAAESTD